VWSAHGALGVALSSLLTLGSCTPEATVGIADGETVDLSLYETFELTIDGPTDEASPFTKYAEVTFRRGARTLKVDGFYDGGGTWRARFCPELAGIWSYEWHLGDRSGSGKLRVAQQPLMTSLRSSEQRFAPHRGHVRRSEDNPLSMVHADGTPHYWAGAKWLSAKNYGPEEKDGEKNDHEEDGSLHDAYVSDERLLAFLDDMADEGLNGLLLKVGLYPLEDDGITWDLDWIRRADTWIAAMNERGIYCQINLFDPWSRQRGSAFGFTPDSTHHVLDAWAEGREADKENYVRYLVARFAGYDNVSWELGNRVRYAGLDAEVFIAEANRRYVPWLRKYDPYRTAIALSDVEQARAVREIDVEEPRLNTDLPGPMDASKPRVVNELVHDCRGLGNISRAYLDATIRASEYRRCYREANWIAFTSGATGSAAASWLDLSRDLNSAADDVLADLGRMKRIIDDLPIRYDLLSPDSSYLVRAQGHRGTRASSGDLYVSYFVGPLDPGTVDVSLPRGTYTVRWLDPATGKTSLEDKVSVESTQERTPLELQRPAILADAVLFVIGPVVRPVR
jgi:hypothetical protein